MVRAIKLTVDYPLLGRRIHYINPITGARLVSTRGGSWSIIGDTLAPVAAEAVKKGLIDVPLWALKNLVMQPALSGLKNYALPFLKKNAFSIAKFLAPSFAWKYGIPAVKWGFDKLNNNASTKQKIGAAAAATAASAIAAAPVVSKIREALKSATLPETKTKKPKATPVITLKTKMPKKRSSRSKRK